MKIKNILITLGFLILAGAVGFLMYQHFKGQEQEINYYIEGNKTTFYNTNDELLNRISELEKQIKDLNSSLENYTIPQEEENSPEPNIILDNLIPEKNETTGFLG